MCSSPDSAASWWLDSLAVGGISVVILSPRTVDAESDGSLQAARRWFPELETDERSAENKTPASSVPRNEGLWDETITSYVTAGIPESSCVVVLLAAAFVRLHGSFSMIQIQRQQHF